MNLIQVCSDLHLENNNIDKQNFCDIIKPNAEILVLACDIGDPFDKIYKEFIDYCSKLFVNILIIAGNHEYYYHSIDETNDIIEVICNSYDNVYYLNNKIFKYKDIVFIGTTLWSQISEIFNDLYTLKDYSKINNFSPYLANEYFNINLQFINESLEKYKNCIVISHHAPSYKCIPIEYKDDSINMCFASHLDYLFDNPNLIGWIYGHVHNNYIDYINKKFLYANCYRTNNYNNQGSLL